MKILAITLRNLNSLRGTWNINLEHNAYTSSGIFAVTGQTGAGKTTIFDAVCLALYAKTPRLGKIEGQKNEIMSKHTDNCMAKVKFESGGKIYICEWTQHKVKGKLQTKHTISSNGKQLNESSHLSETLTLVKKITGMDFDRFVQAVLLEQGGFDKFLKAKKDERAEVLELITGTNIYSKISMRVYERSKEKRKALEDKRKEIDTEKSRFAGMTEEGLQDEISLKEDEISQAETKHESTKEILSWQKEIARLKIDMAGAMEDLRIHSRRSESFEAQRVILESAEKALSLDGEYQTLGAKRDEKRKADSDITVLSEMISSNESKCSRISRELPGLNDELSRLRGNITESPDAVLARIENAVRDYENLKNDFAEAEKVSSRAERECSSAKERLERIESQGKKLSSECKELEERRNSLHDQFMSMEAKTRDAVLDEERSKLIDGEECPLCGSKTHPKTAYSIQGSENPDDLFRIKSTLNEECKKADEALRIANQKLTEAREKWQAAYAEKISAFKEYSHCVEEASVLKAKLSEAKTMLSEAIRPAGISLNDDTPIMITLAREWSAKIDALEKRIQSSQQEIGNIQSVIMSERESLDAKRSEIQKLSEELDGLESSFSEKLRENNFDGEESLRRALSHSGEIESLRRKRDELASESAKFNGRLSDIQRQLDEKQRENLTQESPEKIESLFREEELRLKSLQQEKGILTQKLANVRESNAKVKSLESKYDEMKVSADDWAMLNGLIGSAEGDKFRIYAQKVTLALVVNNANLYLQKMNGRYTLLLTPENNELELSVKDSEQAGEIRPTTNLSGGERFIISLALALGLSQISGSKAQVDSLFIDEGFGSLDEDALNSALEALGEIRRDGRMIGIISHISGISESIRTKINVIRKSEGTSIIIGPGCSGGV